MHLQNVLNVHTLQDLVFSQAPPEMSTSLRAVGVWGQALLERHGRLGSAAKEMKVKDMFKLMEFGPHDPCEECKVKFRHLY